MIALQLAVSAPQCVRSLVIVNSGPELVVRSWRERLQIWQRKLILRILGMRKMGEVLSGRLFPKPEQAALRQGFTLRWAENDPRAYREAFQALIGWSVVEHLGEIRCPVLIIASDADYTPIAQKEAYLARMVQAELVVINDARHAVSVERPEAFNQAVLEFLAKRS